jgi:membrane-bound metal-dependent hydrolase YbcI (DUF457 family)
LPVVGHAFVGAATALATRGSGSESRPSARPFWVPSLVAFAYLPDLPGAFVPAAWFGEARAFGHSILFAALAGGPLGYALAGWARIPVRRGLAIALFSLVIHDVLDLLQATDRVPFWPFSRRPLGLGMEVVPRGTVGEGVVFALAFAVFTLGLGWWRGATLRSLWPRDGRSRLASLGLTGLLTMAALVTHLGRDARERDYRAAEVALRDHRNREALALLDRAEGWPSLAAAGRLDYLRGEAYRGLGDTTQAEEHYRRSYEANPHYFWLLADFSLFYAESDRPVGERRRLVAPLVARLGEEFGREADLSELMRRIERALATPHTSRSATEEPPQ